MSNFNIDTFWSAESAEHQTVAAQTFETLKDQFNIMLELCATSITEGGKILFFGNGGSAADASPCPTPPC
jgi:D-sedoheptulose 7-phosphate isomerase